MDRSELAKRLDEQADSILADSFGATANIRDLRTAASIIRSTAWRPMSEAPRDGAWFIVWPKDYVRPSVGCWYVPWDRWEISGSPSGIDGIEDAVWQPLPPPPSEGAEG
jgi:hypothetical protein